MPSMADVLVEAALMTDDPRIAREIVGELARAGIDVNERDVMIWLLATADDAWDAYADRIDRGDGYEAAKAAAVDVIDSSPIAELRRRAGGAAERNVKRLVKDFMDRHIQRKGRWTAAADERKRMGAKA